jgi:AsmA protein
MTIDDPTPVVKSMKLALTGSVMLDARSQSLGLRADTRFDDTTLSAKIDVDDFSTPRVAFDVRADQFNLDRYATPAPASAPGQKSPAASAEARIDLSALRTLDAHGQIRIGQLQARGIKASDVHASMRAAGARAEIAPIAAQLYGGFLHGSAHVSTEGNRVGLDATLTDVAVGPLLKDAMQKDPIEGRGNVKVALSSAGTMVSAMKRGLDGTASIQVRDGAIRGIDLAQKLRNARALILGGRSAAQRANSAERTDFSELSASFKINSGVATSNDLDLRSPLLRVGGAGRIDLGASTIDYTARVAVVGSLTGLDGRALTDLRGVTVPVRLSGPFDQLSYSIDWGGVARETLKSRLADDVKRRLAPQTEGKGPKLEERARDVLKGLFGR